MRARLLGIGIAAWCAACQPSECREGTLYLTIDYAGGAEAADQVDVLLSVDSGVQASRSAPHVPGETRGTLEVSFHDGYPAGKPVRLVVVARAGDQAIASGVMTTVAAPGCGAHSVRVDATRYPTVTPPVAQLRPFEAQTFASSVPVRWSLMEDLGGVVDEHGAYHAPPEAGTYHLLAESQSDPDQIGVVTITVGPPAQLSLYAGRLGGPGYAEGVGGAARFYYVKGMALDSDGNLYVSDSRNYSIRKMVIATRQVSTLAGGGSPGHVDDVGAAARFTAPDGLAFDGAGTLYVADGDHTIRSISLASGQVGTLAGRSNDPGSADGVGGSARFNAPCCLVWEGGALYVGDRTNRTIRKIVPSTGMVTTVAGTPGSTNRIDGVGAAAQFADPRRMFGDGAGNLYIPDGAAVRKLVLSTATVSTVAPPAGMPFMYGLANLAPDPAGPTNLLASMGPALYRVHLASGEITLYSGVPTERGNFDGTIAMARYRYVETAVTTAAGITYLADGSSIRRLQPMGGTGTVTTLAGAQEESRTLDGDRSVARFEFPSAVASDGAGGLWVAQAQQVRRVSATGQVSTPFPQTTFDFDRQMLVGPDGTLFTIEPRNHVLRALAPGAADFIDLAGVPGSGGNVDGVGAAARFNGPRDLALDESGHLYIADAGNYQIRRVTLSTGEVSTLTGQAGIAGDGNGPLGSARFRSIHGIAYHRGDLFVSDATSIRRISLGNGEVSTLAGDPSASGSVDGRGATARFQRPGCIRGDGFGNLYVVDRNTVRRVVIASGFVSTTAGKNEPQMLVLTGTLPAHLNYPRTLAVLPAGGLVLTDLNEPSLLTIR
jgi:hypothetical protein